MARKAETAPDAFELAMSALQILVNLSLIEHDEAGALEARIRERYES